MIGPIGNGGLELDGRHAEDDVQIVVETAGKAARESDVLVDDILDAADAAGKLGILCGHIVSDLHIERGGSRGRNERVVGGVRLGGGGTGEHVDIGLGYTGDAREGSLTVHGCLQAGGDVGIGNGEGRLGSRCGGPESRVGRRVVQVQRTGGCEGALDLDLLDGDLGVGIDVVGADSAFSRTDCIEVAADVDIEAGEGVLEQESDGTGCALFGLIDPRKTGVGFYSPAEVDSRRRSGVDDVSDGRVAGGVVGRGEGRDAVRAGSRSHIRSITKEADLVGTCAVGAGAILVRPVLDRGVLPLGSVIENALVVHEVRLCGSGIVTVIRVISEDAESAAVRLGTLNAGSGGLTGSTRLGLGDIHAESDGVALRVDLVGLLRLGAGAQDGSCSCSDEKKLFHKKRIKKLINNC